MKKILLVDGNAIFHRAFHALPLLTNDKGEYTNAIYGFTKMLFDISKKEVPDYLVIAFDHKSKTFRHQEFAEYKANRSEPPAELYPQLPRLFWLLEIMQIPIFQVEGFEADDIIGTLVTQADKKFNLFSEILTGDKDSFQLVNENINVIIPKMGISNLLIYNPSAVKEKMGVTPEQIVDYKALRGDSSDNIPGVKGIGDKQAVEMLQRFGNLDNIYQNLDQLTLSQQNKLKENKETAYLSQRMATIIRDMPISLDLKGSHLHSIPVDDTKKALEELNFASLMRSVDDLQKTLNKHIEAEKQQSLF